MTMKKKQKQLVRLLALVLALLLVLGTVASLVFSHAHAQQSQPRDSYALEVEFLEQEQALQIRQRLLYTNRSDAALDRVEFSLYANMFRRLSALPYSAEALGDVLYAGYAPGGIEITSVLVDGQEADWGVFGENELFLRVACSLEPGQSCTFTFEYALLYTQNGAELGVGENDLRLRGFYAQALRLEDGEFVAQAPLQHANYVYADRADFSLVVTLPERYLLAGPGALECSDNGDGTRTWTLTASDLRELCVSIGMRWREYTGTTQAGTNVRVLAASRQGGPRALESALSALNAYEEWFGPLAWDVTIAQSDYALGALSVQGLIWADEDALLDDMALRRALAKQFFGYGAYAAPVDDAWLSDAVSEYVACLATEEIDGRDAFLQDLNERLLPEAQYTLPGGLEVTSAADLFTPSEYESVVQGRGALVMHETRNAMGLEEFLSGLRLFYQRGLETDVMGEYDLVDALDDATGGDWEAFLTDWLFNVADLYQEQYMLDWIE